MLVRVYVSDVDRILGGTGLEREEKLICATVSHMLLCQSAAIASDHHRDEVHVQMAFKLEEKHVVTSACLEEPNHIL